MISMSAVKSPEPVGGGLGRISSESDQSEVSALLTILEAGLTILEAGSDGILIFVTLV